MLRTDTFNPALDKPLPPPPNGNVLSFHVLLVIGDKTTVFHGKFDQIQPAICEKFLGSLQQNCPNSVAITNYHCFSVLLLG